MGIQRSPHTDPIPVLMGILTGIPITTAALPPDQSRDGKFRTGDQRGVSYTSTSGIGGRRKESKSL